MALTLAASGCSTAPARRPPIKVVLVDASVSTLSGPVRSDYEDAGREVVASCSGGGALLVYPVTSNTQASSYAARMVAFPAYDPIDENEDQFNSDLGKSQRVAADDMRKVLNFKDDSQGTDLLWACQKAADYFNGEQYRDAQEKDLFILTDGLQQSPHLDVTSVNLTPARIKGIVGELKADGDLPDLHNVTVWMVGPGADPYHQTSPEKLAQVRRFWLAYFAACGARLSPDRYGTTLQNFPPSSE